MFQKIFLGGSIVLVLAMAPSAYAGKVELSTYYPAPYGEYKNLKSTEDATFATTSGNVVIGSATNPTAMLDVTGGVKPGNAAACTAALAGLMRYNGTEMQYCDSLGSWQSMVGGLAGQSLGANGYARIGNLLLQWGHRNAGSGEENFMVIFPTPFTAVYNVQCSIKTDGLGWDTWSQVVSFTTTTATLAVNWTGYGGTNNSRDVYWFAIGT